MAYLKRTLGEYFFVILTLLIGISVSCWLAFSEFKKSNVASEASFQSDSEERVQVIEKALLDNLAVINSVSAFYHSSEYIDKDEFSIFVGEILRSYSYIEAIDWAPTVKGSERTKFENLGRLNYGQYEFHEKNGSKKFKIRQKADEYFPVLYVEPSANRKNVLGFDYASESIRNEALTRARNLAKTQASAGVTLVALETTGVLFFSPIYKNLADDGLNDKQTLLGFVVAIVPLQNVVDLAIKPLKPAGTNIIIHDITTAQKNLLYVRPSRLTKMSSEEILQSYENPHLLETNQIIDVAGRKWEISIVAADGFYNLNIPHESWIILIAGLSFSFMLGYYMMMRIHENERIVVEVAERTQELSHTKREVELILNSTIEGIIGLDKNGIITFCNPITTQLLGYKYHELIGENFHKLIQPKDSDGKTIDSTRTNLAAVLNYGGMTTAIDNEVFWKKNYMPLRVEYTASALAEEDEITGAVLVFRDITERKKSEELLHRMANYDPLTNIPNRSYFVDLLNKSIARVARSGGKVAVLYMDLNGFKPVNDTKGHAAGDVVLKLFAEKVKTVLRDHDTVARLGGDEFAILADNIETKEDCILIADRINSALQQPFTIDGTDFPISVSIGIAIYPEHAQSLDDLISVADSAMYAAKKNKKLSYLFAK